MAFLLKLLFRRGRDEPQSNPSVEPNHEEKYMNFLERGKQATDKFSEDPPPGVPPALKIQDEKYNHACMKHGWVEFDFSNGLYMGDTARMFGDDFCLVHNISRVFVLDPDNHVVALVSPLRYMMYQAYRMYSKDPPDGNIFTFASRAAAPRWAMRAAANQIIAGRHCSMQQQGAHFTINGAEMNDSGETATVQPVFKRVPYTSISWVVVNKWFEQADRSHCVSYVVSDTGLTVDHNASKCLPLCVREDESDLIMAYLVEDIVCQDQRYADVPGYSRNTLALQFRGGWYAPKTENGFTRIQRAAVLHKDGTWNHTKAYSNNYSSNPSKDLWYIGGIYDVQCPPRCKFVGDHREFQGIIFESDGLENT